MHHPVECCRLPMHIRGHMEREHNHMRSRPKWLCYAAPLLSSYRVRPDKGDFFSCCPWNIRGKTWKKCDLWVICLIHATFQNEARLSGHSKLFISMHFLLLTPKVSVVWVVEKGPGHWSYFFSNWPLAQWSLRLLAALKWCVSVACTGSSSSGTAWTTAP